MVNLSIFQIFPFYFLFPIYLKYNDIIALLVLLSLPMLPPSVFEIPDSSSTIVI